MIVVVAAMLLGGCPPPPLSLDEPDARGNQPPSITSVRGEDATEYTIGLDNNVVRTISTMTVTIVEPDLEDTLYIRGFFDYIQDPAPPLSGQPDSARAVCNVGPSEPRTLVRSFTCNLGAMCRQGDDATNPHVMDVVVSDREPDDAGAMLPRTYLDVQPPGLQARVTYTIACLDPPPT